MEPNLGDKGRRLRELVVVGQQQQQQQQQQLVDHHLVDRRGAYIDDYLAKFKGRRERFQHIRVVFCGREGVGKTTLCCRLRDKDVDITSRKPTEGADLYQHWFTADLGSKQWSHDDDKESKEVLRTRMAGMMSKLPTSEDNQSDVFSSNSTQAHTEIVMEIIQVKPDTHNAGSDMAFVSLWDMGGHLQFQNSHNLFISSHGIYLLVFKLSQFLKDEHETDRLKKWIRMIGTFSAVEYNTRRRKEHHPPLIFVGTFLDDLKKQFSEDYKSRIDDIKSSIMKFPELSSHKHVRFCTIDNTLEPKQGNENLEKLRGQITDLAKHQDQWGRELPYKWLHLELEIMLQREQGTKMLTLDGVLEINKESIAPFNDEEEIKIALEYLHCTRSVIYFREIDCIINDPQFLVDFFSELITEDDFLPRDDMILARDLELYKTKGELTHALINGILNQRQNNDFLYHSDNLLALMEKFGLIVRLQITDITTGDLRFSETYTVPSKLEELKDLKHITFSLKQLAVSKTLCLIFNDFVPEELFNRVFAVIMRTFKISTLPGTPTQGTACLFRGFGCFKINDLCSMILSMHWERSTIAVTVFSPFQPKLPPGAGRHAREALKDILQETLVMSCQQHYQYSYKMHCDFYLHPYDTPVDMYSVMYADEGMPCKGDDCRGKHRLTRSDLQVWEITEAAGTTSQRLGFDSVETFLDRRPTPRELGRLSFVIESSQCVMLFIELGLSEAVISNIKDEARTLGVQTQTTKMFLVWTCSYPNHTFRHIQLAMEKAQIACDDLGSAIHAGSDTVTLDGMKSNEKLVKPLDVDKITCIVDNIGKNYFNLFLELGLSASAIERCELNHPNVERRFEALLKLWVSTYQEQATVIRILKAMKMCHMDWVDTALTYCR